MPRSVTITKLIATVWQMKRVAVNEGGKASRKELRKAWMENQRG
jgi:hypothetical protein